VGYFQELVSSSIIALREVFEASILVSIVTATLRRLGKSNLLRYVYLSVVLSVIVGLLAGGLLWTIYGYFPSKELVEAVFAIVAAILITTVIYWMARVGPTIAQHVEERVAIISSAKGVMYFTLIIVSREVIETILLSAPFLVRNPLLSATGIVLGAVIAVLIAYTFYIASTRISLRRFFLYTSIVLVLIASGLVGYGVHELLEWVSEERNYSGLLVVQVYNLDLPRSHPLADNGWAGSLLSVLLGYSDEMKLGRVATQFPYLVASLVLVLRAYRRK